MKYDDAPTVISIRPTTATATAAVMRKESSESSGSGSHGLVGKGRYKLWVLTAILLLASWSMFTGSVTLKWSSNGLVDSASDFSIPDDVDILEVEEMEKMVRRMWDVYTHRSSDTRLPRFWQEAFEAAYEALTSDVAAVRDAAVSEIAKMYLLRSRARAVLDPLPLQSIASISTNASQRKKSPGQPADGR